MTAPVLRVGTRGSALALAQAGQVGRAVAEAAGGTVELVRIRTEGDVNTGPLATIGGTGVFVTAVREALLGGEVDLVVHSFKDLPTAPVDGIALGAVPPRESPSDALCDRENRTLERLPAGARIGTGSPRRMAQLRSLRSDLELVAIRGNIDTRLGRAAPGDLDAVLLAAAGLRRLGRQDAISEEFDPRRFLPAPAQGALAVESRAGETPWFADGLAAIDDAPTRWAALAERAVLTGLEAGCSAPVSALGRFPDAGWDVVPGRSGQSGGPASLTLSAQVTAPDGSRVLRDELVADIADDAAATASGLELADRLLAAGAAGLVHGP